MIPKVPKNEPSKSLDRRRNECGKFNKILNMCMITRPRRRLALARPYLKQGRAIHA